MRCRVCLTKITNWKPINNIRNRFNKIRHIKVTEAETIMANFVGKTAETIDIVAKKTLGIENASDRIFKRLINFLERFEREGE